MANKVKYKICLFYLKIFQSANKNDGHYNYQK